MCRTSSTPPLPASSRANLLGAAWMVLAMACFAVEDAFVKGASATLPVGEILVIFGLGGVLVFTALSLVQGQRLLNPDVLSLPMRIRVVFEVLGRLFYALALVFTPLAAATVILQATPLVVVAGAALVFGERVGWRRWLAILVGLVGVLIILSPGTSAFTPLSILAVLGMLGFAGRDLASRAAPKSLSANVLGVYGFLAVIVAGVAYSVIWERQAFVLPSVAASLYMVGAISAGVVAYAALMRAMRTGDVSAVTPFRYTRLIFGLALGLLIFGERLSANMLIGSALIVAAGLVILWRGRVRAVKA